MNKVTYEKAEKAIKNANYFIAGFASNAFYRISYDDMRTIEDFIDQHKPPTYEEVVKAWEEKLGKGVRLEEYNGAVTVLVDGVRKCVVSLNTFQKEENITIQYLESLKENEI